MLKVSIFLSMTNKYESLSLNLDGSSQFTFARFLELGSASVETDLMEVEPPTEQYECCMDLLNSGAL
jgi:hypothetical protein